MYIPILYITYLYTLYLHCIIIDPCFCLGWKFGFVPHACQSILFSDAHCTYSLATSVFLWSTCCFLSCSVCSSFATLSFWPFLPIDPRYKVKPSDGHGSRMISIRHRPGTWPAKKKWMQPIPQWLHEPGGDTMRTGDKAGPSKSVHVGLLISLIVFLYVLFMGMNSPENPPTSWPLLCQFVRLEVHTMFISSDFPYLLHSFNRVVNSCNLWFKSFGQTVAHLYMYVCLNMYMHIMCMCHI